MHLVRWIAASVIVCNVLVILPSAFWWLTGTNILPRPLIRHFDPDGEANLFAWYSSLLLILVSISALMNFGLDSLRAETATWKRYFWLWFCAVTLLLSLDEVATIHESIGKLVQRHLQTGSYAAGPNEIGKRWILAYAPGIVAMIGSLTFVFFRLWRGLRWISLCALTGLAFWIIALGLEFLLTDLCETSATQLRCQQAEVLLEEASEIFGTTGLLIAFVWYAQQRAAGMVSAVRAHVDAG